MKINTQKVVIYIYVYLNKYNIKLQIKLLISDILYTYDYHILKLNDQITYEMIFILSLTRSYDIVN